MPFCPSQVFEKSVPMPMKGRPSISLQIHIHLLLQSNPARGKEMRSPYRLSTGGKQGSQQHLRRVGHLGYIALLNTASAMSTESPPQWCKATAAPQLIAATL